MTTKTPTNLSADDLAGVTGGTFTELAQGGFGLRTVYRGAVKNVTATLGGWKLANQMYGTPEHGASFQEKLRARGALKEYLDGSDRLPSWAPNW
jgi:hypothetical protein